MSQKFRKLEVGEVYKLGDLFACDRVARELGTIVCDTDNAVRPLPDPQWRKISDGPVTYPCFVGYWRGCAWRHWYAGNILESNVVQDDDKIATHWLPAEIPAPPPQPKPEEEWWEKKQAECYTAEELAKAAFNAGREYQKGLK